jgi:hypothetical protein
MGNWVAVHEWMEYMERIWADDQGVAGIGMRRGVPGWKLVHCAEKKKWIVGDTHGGVTSTRQTSLYRHITHRTSSSETLVFANMNHTTTTPLQPRHRFYSAKWMSLMCRVLWVTWVEE